MAESLCCSLEIVTSITNWLYPSTKVKVQIKKKKKKEPFFKA